MLARNAPQRSSRPGIFWLRDLRADGTRIRWLASKMHDKRLPWSSWHDGQQHVVILVERGGMWFEPAGGTRRTLEAGDLLWNPPGSGLLIGAEGPVRHRNIRFQVDLAERAHQARPFRVPTKVWHRAWAVVPVLQLWHDHRAGQHAAEELRGLLITLTTRLHRAGTEAESGLDPGQRARVQTLVDDSIASGLSPDDLAAAAGLTPDWFSRRFRQTYGQAPRRWLVDERVRRAAAELRDGAATVAAIATAWGYANPSQFCRQFRRVYGCTPAQWRQVDDSQGLARRSSERQTSPY